MDLRTRADAIFDAALDLPPESRDAFVAERCAGDAELHQTVRALLAAHDRSDGILELDARRLLGEEPAPLRLGVYRLGRSIGQGGMGVVYEAERDDGQFLRRVAIKLLRSGEDEDLRRRVLAERQILAALDHPNIARLLDGGVSGDGRPYLVMEHIEGLPVDVYCERMRLTVAERLRLFVVIARTVAYAHRNLIVHRDLKPSNILVTTEGVVKLLDFGVAKLLNPGLGSAAAHTLEDRLAFTPDYASPEQLRGEALTTQADIFALGVLLYELLTGRRPFAASGLAGLLQQVAEVEPERPSARVLRAETVPSLDGIVRAFDPAAVARARQTTPARLARALRGDVAAIVVTALSKQPRSRYGSADLLADDIERHLSAQPVLARRRGTLYALGRFTRRHRVPVTALGIALASVLLGAGGAVWQARAARAERDRAEIARAHAEQVTDFMIELFEAGAPGTAGTGPVAARELMRRGTARIEELAGQPGVQSHMLTALGRVHEALGEYEQAQQLLQRAVAVGGVAQPRDANNLAESLLYLGIVQRRRSVFDSAETSFMRARELLAGDPKPGVDLLARVLQQLTSIAIYRGRMAEADRRIRDAIALQQRQLGLAHPATLLNLRQLGSVQARRGDPGAEATLRQVIALRPQATGSTRGDAATDRLQLAEYLLLERRSLAEAEAIFRQEAHTMRPDVADERGAAIWARGGIADLMELRGDWAGAERLRRQVLDLDLQVYGPSHPLIGDDQTHLAQTLLKAGQVSEAERLFQQSASIQDKVFGRRHISYAATLQNRAAIAEARGQYRAADSLIAAGMEVRLQHSGRATGVYVEGLLARARLQARLGEYSRAEALLLEALELAPSQYLPGSRQLRVVHKQLADLYQHWRRPADAARHRRLAQP